MRCKHKTMLFYGSMPNGLNGPVTMWRCPECGVLSTYPDVPWMDDCTADLYLLVERTSVHRASLQKRLNLAKNESLIYLLSILVMLPLLWRQL